MTQILAVLAAITAYGLFILAAPDRPCPKCSGWGRRKRRRRLAACGRCKGTGKTFRPGARLVHRGAAMVTRYVRERLEDER